MSKYFLKEPDPFFEPSGAHSVDLARLNQLRLGPLSDLDDLDAAEDLLDFVSSDLTAFGTGGGEVMTNGEMRTALLTLRALMGRIELPLELPFMDFNGFKSYWLKNDGYHSWQARRVMVSGWFDDVYVKVVQLRDRSLSATLVDPISPHAVTGWPRVDSEIKAMRDEFRDAITVQNCRSVGLHAVAVLEAVSAVAYVHEKHGASFDVEPPVRSTKDRLLAVVEHELPGKGNVEMRKLARSAIEAAQAVKHGDEPDRKKAGITADAVLIVANILRRARSDD